MSKLVLWLGPEGDVARGSNAGVHHGTILDCSMCSLHKEVREEAGTQCLHTSLGHAPAVSGSLPLPARGNWQAVYQRATVVTLPSES